MEIALALALTLPLAAALRVALQDEAGSAPQREAAPATRVVFEGRVLFPDGRPAGGAAVATSAGGETLAAEDGGFEIEVDVPLDAACVEVTAAAEGRATREPLVASARVAPAALAKLTRVGTLRLAPETACSPRWLPTFGAKPGTGGTGSSEGRDVRALAVFDDGRGPALYAGGAFRSLGGIAASNIARWDGVRWSPLGTGVGLDAFTAVQAFAVHDDGGAPVLYVGGGFSTIGGVPARNVARWDGSSWAALGSGLANSGVYALEVFDDGSGPALYAGGVAYGGTGSALASGIARWDGSAWTPVGSGMGGSPSFSPQVYALEVFDDGTGPALYAGGVFASAGGVPASHVARWDGAAWSALGSGTSHPVRALRAFDDGGGPALFAGGGWASTSFVGRWDGAAWSAVGAGTDGIVMALEVGDDGGGPALFAAGDFAHAGGVPARRVARWDGASWSGSTSGPDELVAALVSFDDGGGPAVFAGGQFPSIDGAPPGQIARLRSSAWSSLDDGLDDAVSALAVDRSGERDVLYVGGTFRHAGSVPLSRIARWDESGWSPLGSGVDGPGAPEVRALALFDDGGGAALYAGGTFVTAGGAPANRIARWDGAGWTPLGVGTNGAVHALAVFDDGTGPALYATGQFTMAGGAPANRVARWDGSSWSALGSGVGGGASVMGLALAVFDDGGGPRLYVGGNFTSAGGAPARRIARWDGASWSAVGATLYGGAVHALAVHDDGSGAALVAGGRFSDAGGVVLDRLARFDGASWSPLGGGANDEVLALASLVVGGVPTLVAGGEFTVAGGVAARGVARWDGAAWSPLGAGVGQLGATAVRALAALDDGGGATLCAGGDFDASPARDGFVARFGCARRLAQAR